MPVSFRTATSGTAASGAGFTVTTPAGTAFEDFIVVAVANAGTSGPAAPSGWTIQYQASGGSGQSLSIYTAPYRDAPSFAFTNVASLAAWICQAYYQTGTYVDYDTHLNANNTSNNTTLSTGAPTPNQDDSFEALIYAWTSAATITTPAANSTIVATRANGTSISTALGRNNNTSLPSGVICTAFSHTLSATNNRKTGVGLVLHPIPIPGEILGGGTASGTSTVEGALRAPRVDVAGVAGGLSTATATIAMKRSLGTGAILGRTTVVASVTRRRALTAASAGSAVTTVTIGRKRHLIVSAAGTAATTTPSIQRKRAIVALSSGIAVTTAQQILRTRAIVALSAGRTTVVALGPYRVHNITAFPSWGKTTVTGRVFNRIMVVWTGSTFAVEGPYPVLLWDGAGFKVEGDLDMVTWREPNDYFDLVVT